MTAAVVAAQRSDEAGISSHSAGRAKLVGGIVAAVVAVSVSTRSGVGLAIAILALLIATAMSVGHRTSAGRACLAMVSFAPWLVIRDNTWLAISNVCTSLLVVAVAAIAGATRQSIFNFSISALGRRVGGDPPAISSHDRRVGAAIRGTLLAVPVVGVFWLLLASADDVFASLVNPASLPIDRIVLFAILLPAMVSLAWFASTRRRTADASAPTLARYVGPVESSIILAAVSTLFTAFVVLRIATFDRQLGEGAWRSEVRSGFFQLLFVAALTVLLVLAIRHVAGRKMYSRRVRRLAWLTIGLAAVIDGLALLRIAEYVEQSFLSPLRFWSFGFGVWLLVLLAMTAIRLTDVGGDQRWFTGATLVSWAIFLFSFAVINPDARIAQHNFDNAPTGEDEWIAVQPLMWLSEDATPILVDNIEVLRPMPNDRYVRTVSHLCSRDLDGSWRELHFSRAAAKDAITDLC